MNRLVIYFKFTGELTQSLSSALLEELQKEFNCLCDFLIHSSCYLNPFLQDWITIEIFSPWWLSLKNSWGFCRRSKWSTSRNTPMVRKTYPMPIKNPYNPKTFPPNSRSKHPQNFVMRGMPLEFQLKLEPVQFCAYL